MFDIEAYILGRHYRECFHEEKNVLGNEVN